MSPSIHSCSKVHKTLLPSPPLVADLEQNAGFGEVLTAVALIEAESFRRSAVV
jgi:hypothetical protein